MPGDHTAILFFSHRPECEWRNKRFVRRDYGKHHQVAEALYRHTREATQKSGFPVLEINGPQQRGKQFGTRLANAFTDAFAQGYDRVIAVGSDCPHLHEVDWPAVAERLEEGTPVLGPTSDGTGTYLIGLTRTQFRKDAFEALPWKSPALLSALVRHLSEATGTSPVLLDARSDVNGHGDVVALTRHSSSLPQNLVARLRSALGPTRHTPSTREVHATRHVYGHRSRAPPLPSSRRFRDSVTRVRLR